MACRPLPPPADALAQATDASKTGTGRAFAAWLATLNAKAVARAEEAAAKIAATETRRAADRKKAEDKGEGCELRIVVLKAAHGDSASAGNFSAVPFSDEGSVLDRIAKLGTGAIRCSSWDKGNSFLERALFGVSCVRECNVDVVVIPDNWRGPDVFTTDGTGSTPWAFSAMQQILVRERDFLALTAQMASHGEVPEDFDEQVRARCVYVPAERGPRGGKRWRLNSRVAHPPPLGASDAAATRSMGVDASRRRRRLGGAADGHKRRRRWRPTNSLAVEHGAIMRGRNPSGEGRTSFRPVAGRDGSGVIDPVKERAILVWAQTQVTVGKGLRVEALPKLKEARGSPIQLKSVKQRPGQEQKAQI